MADYPETPDLTSFLRALENHFAHLRQENEDIRRELAYLRIQLPDWVDEQEAQRLTGLSGTTLWRERKKPADRRVIVWKRDHGVRYLRASLLAHNQRRTAQ